MPNHPRPIRRSVFRGVAVAAAVTALPLGASVASADAPEGPVFPPRTEECKVPTLLFPVAAVVDVDSLEGCGYFEDPNFFENRKANGTYDDSGVFSRLFG